NLAWMLAQSGSNLDEALSLARIASDQLPGNPTVLDTMGWIYYKRGAYASAADVFEECVRKDAKNPVYRYHLCLSYAKTGDRDKAKAALNEALKISPSFDGADDARSTLSKL